MSSFTQVLLEGGVEVELPGNLSDVITILDEDVPQFNYQGYGYRLSPAKGSIGNRWDLIVRAVNPSLSDLSFSPLLRLEVENADDGMVLFRVPPLSEQQCQEADDFDSDRRLFGSFVFQVLNSFQRRNLIELPGPLPEF